MPNGSLSTAGVLSPEYSWKGIAGATHCTNLLTFYPMGLIWKQLIRIQDGLIIKALSCTTQRYLSVKSDFFWRNILFDIHHNVHNVHNDHIN